MTGVEISHHYLLAPCPGRLGLSSLIWKTAKGKKSVLSDVYQLNKVFNLYLSHLNNFLLTPDTQKKVVLECYLGGSSPKPSFGKCPMVLREGRIGISLPWHWAFSDLSLLSN